MDIPPGLPKFWGDRDRLAQVLTNLLSNAAKYTPPGGHISLSVREIARDDKNFLEFAVQDNGIGISEENKGADFQAVCPGEG